MSNIILFFVIGFVAQMIDGSLGMGYKVSSTTFLLSTGLLPVIASASVHTAGIFTSAASGYAHYRFGNLDKNLMMRLAVPGVLGAIVGAALLTIIPTDIIKPAISIYLLLMGLRIVLKSLSYQADLTTNVHTTALGMVGGFFDAIGGGGWGPIVTSTLIVNGHNPRRVIGSVNIAEFFVTMASAATFILAIHEPMAWDAVGGLIVGGVLAAPFAARVASTLPTQRLMLAVGLLISILSVRSLLLAFGII